MIEHHNRKEARRDEAGFTLLELVLVLFILAAISAAAVSLVGQADGQERRRETLARLETIRTAVIGRDRPAGREGGFAFDTGRLPTTIDELVRGESLETARVIESLPYVPTVSDGHRLPVTLTGAPIALPPEAFLQKGYRGGYIALGARVAGESQDYRDAWDAPFQWIAGGTTQEPLINVIAPGADDRVDSTRPANSPAQGNDLDVTLDIAANEWSSLIGGLSVTVRNGGVTALAAGHRAILSIYDAPNPPQQASTWRQYQSDPTPLSLAPGDTALVAFPSSPSHPRIAHGDHVVMLVDSLRQPVLDLQGRAIARRVRITAGGALPIDVELRTR